MHWAPFCSLYLLSADSCVMQCVILCGSQSLLAICTQLLRAFVTNSVSLLFLHLQLHNSVFMQKMNDSVQLEDIAEVCSTCYESVNVAGRDRCSHTKVIIIISITKHTVHSNDHLRVLCASAHLQECCVVGENGEVESVRPKPTSDMILNIHSYTGRKFNGNYKLCRNYPPCESRCTFAHGNLELLAWNGGSSCSLSY